MGGRKRGGEGREEERGEGREEERGGREGGRKGGKGGKSSLLKLEHHQQPVPKTICQISSPKF